MINSNWQRLQPIVLGSYSIAIAVAILLVLIKPSQDPFPQDLTLKEWQEITSDRLNYGHKIYQGRKQKRAKHALETEVLFIAASDGDNLSLINQYKAIALTPQDILVKSRAGIGFYGLWAQNNRTHLNTCIHPSGQTAFTPQQFGQLANGNLRSRILPWLFGFQDLRDWGCLWVNMSVANNNLSQKETQELLEQNLIALSNTISQK
jgi:cyanosortase A-associated protein